MAQPLGKRKVEPIGHKPIGETHGELTDGARAYGPNQKLRGKLHWPIGQKPSLRVKRMGQKGQKDKGTKIRR